MSDARSDWGVMLWRWLTRRVSSKNALPWAIFGALVAGVFDYLTTAEAAFTLFYAFPVALVAWFRSRRVAYILIAQVMLTSGAIDVGTGTRPLRFTAWNLIVELGLYLLFARVVELLRARMALEGELRTKAIDELRHAERLATVGKLAAGLAHELGTPMNVISGRADLIGRDKGATEHTKKSAVIIGDQIARMSTIIRNLLDFSRRGGLIKTKVDLAALCESTALLLRPLAKTANVELHVSGEAATAEVNPSEIQQVLINLVTNAVHAMSRGGSVSIVTAKAQARTDAEGAFCSISVTDNGTGITPEVLPRIFDPFFTTKDVGQGTGLGLSVAYGIVRDHGGNLLAESQLGAGSTFRILLPS
jgi:signal transduction histidine kinase